MYSPPRRRSFFLLLILVLLTFTTLAAAAKSSSFPPTDVTDTTAPATDDDTSYEDKFGHKPLFPMDTRDYISFFIVAIGLVIAAAGGIGGGGILVPIYILVAGFDPKHAIALSNITILGSAISNVTLASFRRHPSPKVDRPLICWDLILVMEPIVICFAVLGSLANKLLPSLVVTIFLVLMLSYLSQRTMKKGIKLWKKEGGWAGVFGGGQAGALPTASTTGNANEGQHLLSSNTNKNNYHDNASESASASPMHIDALRRLKESERTVAAWKPLLLTLCFGGMACLQILKTIFPCGSPTYLFFTLAVIPWVLPFFLLARSYVLKDYRRKAYFNYNFPRGDVRWDERNSITLPLWCSLAGLGAGLFGIGGGMVKSPLLLEIGVLPLVTSATVATMILFTTASATLSLLIFGLLPEDYGVFCFVFGLVCTGVGNRGVSKVLMKHKKQSVVVLSVASIMCVSVVTMGIESVRRLVLAPDDIWKFGTLCGGGGGGGE